MMEHPEWEEALPEEEPLAGADPSFQMVQPDRAYVDHIWEEKWRPGLIVMVEGEDGEIRQEISLEKLKGELADCWHLIETAPKVYYHVTGGMTDDPRASAQGIIAAADHRVAQLTHDLLRELDHRTTELRATRARIRKLERQLEGK